jgi:tetratricopeptide (TPR) repeat protein
MSRVDDVLKDKFADYQERFPDERDDRIWAAVAEAFALTGDGPRTLLAWERARTLNPEWSPHRLGYAKALIRAHQWMKAVHELQTCSELEDEGLDPERFENSDLYYLGYALFGAGRFKEASDAWRAAGNRIKFWGNPDPLKHYHLHRGWALHLERQFPDAIEAYMRALVAPGPGDCAPEDDMDADAVEASQDEFNPGIERFLILAQEGELLDPAELKALPYDRD